QHAVACEVAVPIVDVLEMVDVERDDGQRLPTRCSRDGAHRSGDEGAAARHPGQLVDIGVTPQLRLHSLPAAYLPAEAFGVMLEHPDHAGEIGMAGLELAISFLQPRDIRDRDHEAVPEGNRIDVEPGGAAVAAVRQLELLRSPGLDDPSVARPGGRAP